MTDDGSMDDDWPAGLAWMAERCRPYGISYEHYLAYQLMETAEQEKLTDFQRAESQRDSRDPKAETWGLALLYPTAVLAIWVGLSPPGLRVCVFSQWLLTIIGGVWIAWVSCRILIRERHRWLVWVHYALGALGVAGCLVVMYAFTVFGRLPR
jgi:hypothetical protein